MGHIGQPQYTCAHRNRRRGVGLIYAVISFSAIMGFCSLAIDLGAAQLVKTQLQRAADATAHDYILLFNQQGKSYANSNGPNAYSASVNPVNMSSGAHPTYAVSWGYWKASNKTFSTSNNGGDIAVRVTATCKKANGNAVPLLFGSILGARSIDMTATAIAASVVTDDQTIPIDAQSNPYFAGMPSTTTGANGDDAVDNAPTRGIGIPVTPGAVMTFINTTGTSSVAPGSMAYSGAEGATTGTLGLATNHGVSWDGTGTPNSENGIANAIMPESSLMGLFLTDSQPDSTGAPSTVDWTSASNKNKTSYSNLQVKAPFYIGDGKTSGGVVQQFTVPSGATRFYLGLWDGIQYNNNDGSISVTVTTTARSIRLVK